MHRSSTPAPRSCGSGTRSDSPGSMPNHPNGHSVELIIASIHMVNLPNATRSWVEARPARALAAL